MNELKHEGQVVYYNDVKHYALIAEKIPAASGGWYVEKYFAPLMRIIFQMSERITVGQYARFEVSATPPRNPGEYRLARNIELFDTAEQMRVYVVATEARI